MSHSYMIIHNLIVHHNTLWCRFIVPLQCHLQTECLINKNSHLISLRDGITQTCICVCVCDLVFICVGVCRFTWVGFCAWLVEFQCDPCCSSIVLTVTHRSDLLSYHIINQHSRELKVNILTYYIIRVWVFFLK